MKWGQHEPYNMYNPGGYDKEEKVYYDHAAVCCGAMSIAMVLTHPKFRPKVSVVRRDPWISDIITDSILTAYESFVPNWQKMWNFKETEYAQLYPDRFGTIVASDIAPLLTQICTNLKVEWGHYTSTCLSRDMELAFSINEIACQHLGVRFSMQTIEQEIGQGYPIILDGSLKGGGAGHLWVCSAILKVSVPYIEVPLVNDPELNIVIDSGTRTFNYLHHNWGWGKSNQPGEEGWDYNGYYAESSEIRSGKGLSYDEDFSTVVNKPKGWGTYYGFTMYAGLRNAISGGIPE